jgi:LysM repeat protein
MPLRIKVADKKTPTGRKRPQAKSAGKPVAPRTGKPRQGILGAGAGTKGRRAKPFTGQSTRRTVGGEDVFDRMFDSEGQARAKPTPKSKRKAPAKTAAKSKTGSFKKSGQAVMAAKGRTSPVGGRPSTKTAATYKVKSGDTLSEIAKKRGTTIKKMMAANPSIKNANQIKTGQTLKVPAAGKKASSPYTGLTAGQIKTGARKAQRGGMMMMKKTKGMSKGGKMPMAKDPDTGKMVPAFAVDGKGKMKAGGMMKKAKGMARGGATKKTKGMAVGGAMKKTKGMAKGGAMKKTKGMARGGAMKKTKGMARGGMMKKTKGMARGGMMKGTKGYSRGGVARGMGAATKGGKFTRGG